MSGGNSIPGCSFVRAGLQVALTAPVKAVPGVARGAELDEEDDAGPVGNCRIVGGLDQVGDSQWCGAVSGALVGDGAVAQGHGQACAALARAKSV